MCHNEMIIAVNPGVAMSDATGWSQAETSGGKATTDYRWLQNGRDKSCSCGY